MTHVPHNASVWMENVSAGGNIIIMVGDVSVEVRTLVDPLHTDEQPILVCRQAQVATLNKWLDEACYEAKPGARRLVVVTGRRESGKRDLLRTWLTGVQARRDAPVITIAPFLPPFVPPQVQAASYEQHSALQRDRSRYGNRIAAHFPPLFKLGSYPWVVLAAQLAGQSRHVRDLLDKSNAVPDRPNLRSEPPVESGSLQRSLTTFLRLAARERPIVVVMEHVQHADLPWRFLLNLWLEDLADLPILFVVVVDTPLALDDARLKRGEDTWLGWLAGQTKCNHARGHLLHVDVLDVGDIRHLLDPASQQWASELWRLSGASPVVLRELLGYWRDQGGGAGRRRTLALEF